MSIRTKINWKEFTLRQKAEFIWDYYRLWIFAALLALVAVGYTYMEHISYKAPLINIVMVNSEKNMTDPAAGFDEFLDALGYENYEGAVSVNTTVRFTESKEAEYQNYQLEQFLFALAHTGEQEILLSDEPLFRTYAQEGMLADLSYVLSMDTLEQLEDRLIYSDYPDSTEPYPCGILLTDHPFILENNYYTADCYVGIFYNSDQPQIAEDFIVFLLTR